MAVPKRRHSTTRSKKRRSHDAITLPNPVLCPQCGEPKMPHRVCQSCGTYKGRQAVQTEE
ncbi:MAG: 50S ribosomal protein L32 [Desulfarculaceae bacterium]|nr:50S ribosomal protein L32 [Desulfarculaceae bacterium]MCF8071868.1 50S ribosomal protein L32 [Desulfarculaceae bacterium]MCF8101418.1 50S ribosomal protein L32 [Desulfarculaceae bacterium]MCF8117409.1 50S ribosomal protein L32 [Desulfarculaceae bacterium]